MNEQDLFNHLRSMSGGRLTQGQVDAMNLIIASVGFEVVKQALNMQEVKVQKFITVDEMEQVAKKFDISLASLQAVNEVECPDSGFLPNGKVTILFEPHIFYRRLGEEKCFTLRKRIMQENPHICYEKWKAKGYGTKNEQHTKLELAKKYHPELAMESCSWGVGQVMGFHWKSLGFNSIYEFVAQMEESEGGQLDIMMRYLEKNNLLKYLRNQDWESFARGYNGAGYKQHQYDVRLKKAYNQFLA